MIITALVICGTGCSPNNDPVTQRAEALPNPGGQAPNSSSNGPLTQHAEALVIVKRLVERETQHSMHEDLRRSKNKDADANLREESSARTKLNCEDLAKLRSLIETGRPLADYSPIEKLGRFVGKDPNRFFLCGLTGFVTHQGPEPYSIMIDVDSANVIAKVGPIVAAQ